MLASEIEQLEMKPFEDSAARPDPWAPAQINWYVVRTPDGRQVGAVVLNSLTHRWEWGIMAHVLRGAGPCAGPAAGFEAIKARLLELR